MFCIGIYLCKYATRTRAQKGFLFVQHPSIGNFNSSEVEGVTALYFQTSTKIEKILWLPDEAKCFQNPKSATSMLLFQQWPGAFNKWGSFKCLPSFQANSYVRSQTTNNQRSSSKNPRLTDSRQKRAQKKYRSGGPLSTRSLFEAKNSGSNGLPKQERRGRTHCTCLGSFTSGPAARSPIYPLLKQHGNENPVWPIRNKSLSSEQFVFHCHGNLLEGNTWGACAWMLMAYHPLLQSSPSNNCPNKILIEIRMWLTILGTSRTDRYNNVFPDN